MPNLFGSPLLTRLLFKNQLVPSFTQSVRGKAKKASSSKRNPSQGKGQYYGLKVTDGSYVPKFHVLMTQNRLRLHGGLNVGVCGRFTLMSLTEGKVVITCEKPDVDWTHSWNKLFYAGREGVTFYKKYVHVIPRTLHNRFKVIDRI